MKNVIQLKSFTLSCLLFFLVYAFGHTQQVTNTLEKFIPLDTEIHQQIVAMDSIFFSAYNTCDLKKQATIYSDNLEFFHDKNGLMTSKQKILDGTKKYICGKVTREVLKETIEVYPIKDYGAVEIGYHQFYNNQEPNITPTPSKFILMWQKINNVWKISKVISLH